MNRTIPLALLALTASIPPSSQGQSLPPGAVEGWRSTTPMPLATTSQASAEYNGYLYIAGGSGPAGFRNQVVYARLLPDGNLGPWNFAAPFAGPRGEHAAVAAGGFLYVIGGRDGSVPWRRDVQFASLRPDGSTGAWMQTTPLPAPRMGPTAVVAGDRLYVIGGDDATRVVETVFSARIRADGSLGAWSATTPLPKPRFRHGSVLHGGRIYVIGGFSLAWPNYHNDVFSAAVNPDGSLGAWTPTTPLPVLRERITSVVHDGFLYVLGGYDRISYYNDVYYARLESDGGVGAWSPTTPFAEGRANHGSVAKNGFLYVFGGGGPASLFNDVQVTRLSPRAVPPVVVLTATPVSGTAPLRVNFTGSARTATGRILSYDWDFNGDGRWDFSSPGVTRTSFTYSTPGAYTARLRCLRNDGVTATAEVRIDVRCPNRVRVWIVQPKTADRISTRRALVNVNAVPANRIDFRSVVLQYRKTGTAAWTTAKTSPLGSALPSARLTWDTAGLPYGPYDLRTGARDALGRPAWSDAPGGQGVIRVVLGSSAARNRR